MSFYRQSFSTPSTTFGSPLPQHSQQQQGHGYGLQGQGQGQPNYYMSSPLSPQMQQQQQQTPQSPFQNYHSPQSPLSPYSSSGYFEQSQTSHPYISQRKSDGFEPMSTSPTATAGTNLQLQPQPPLHYLPSFLTGDHVASTHAHHTVHTHNLIAPEASAIFDSHDLNRNTPISTQAKPPGPPISGLGELSGIGNSTASFEQHLAATAANISGGSLSPSSPSTPISGCWVTIFGFPTSAATFVTTTFSKYGTIVETKANPGSNWLHVKYSNKIEARRALNRNGTVIGGTMMVGVVPYEEPSEDFPPSRRLQPTSSLTMTSPPIRESLNMNVNISRPSSSASMRKENMMPGTSEMRDVKNRIRPLAKHNNSMSSGPVLPKENSGLMARAVEYMFGW